MNILLAANFHDIGKISITDEILNKPDKLTLDEFNIMKSHVNNSYDILSESISPQVIEILMQHHERLDGSGYPNGLKGNQISLSGRILAIADSFDAMTTDRVYKLGKTADLAIEELPNLSNLYDQSIVEVLKLILKENNS